MSKPPPGLLGTPRPALVPAADAAQARAVAAAGALPLLRPHHPDPDSPLPDHPFALDADGAADHIVAPFHRSRRPPILLLGESGGDGAGFPALFRRATALDAARRAHGSGADAVLLAADDDAATLLLLSEVRTALPFLPLLAALTDPALIPAALAGGAAAVMIAFAGIAATSLPRLAPGASPVPTPAAMRDSHSAAALRLNLRRRKQAAPPMKSPA